MGWLVMQKDLNTAFLCNDLLKISRVNSVTNFYNVSV